MATPSAWLPCLGLCLCLGLPGQSVQPLQPLLPAERAEIPVLDGTFWRIAGNPDLGPLNGPAQQPVDFAIWQAADGTWQLWSCIRHTAVGGNSRLFHRWQAARITDANWQPMGIAMQADPALGETAGGLQAPFVLRDDDGIYRMFYGDWQRICLASSTDGKHFTRWRNQRGQPDLFAGPYDNSRDPMVLRIGGLWHCYYTGHRLGATWQAAVFCRTSDDLVHWSEAVVVAAGGLASSYTNWYGGDCECPFVVARNGDYYLFRNLLYGPYDLNVQYASRNPLSWGAGGDRNRIGHLFVAAPEIVLDRGQYYVAALTPALDGIRISRLRWASAPR